MMSSAHPIVHLSSGLNIQGKWNHHRYRVIKKLGEGARGSIYLVDSKNGKFALKMSKDRSVITREAKMLRQLSKVQGIQLGPSLYDVDDFIGPQSANYSFYVMEYVQGVGLKEWYQARVGRQERLAILMKQLLTQLHHLHALGFVYGDIKLENLIIDSRTKDIRLVDVGGVTQIGRSVREYTTQYDRGYWKMGERRADPAYDLFSVAICFLQLDPTFKRADNSQDLMKLIARAKTMTPFHPVIRKAVNGEYKRALAMKRDLDQIKFQSSVARRRSSQLHGGASQRQHDDYKKEVLGLTAVITVQLTVLIGLIFYF